MPPIDWSSLFYSTASLVASACVLKYGGGKFVENAGILGRRLGVSSTLVTLLIAGVEYEQLAVVIAAVARHNGSLALGNVMGSSVANILGAFALGVLVHPNHVVFDSSARFYTTILLGLATMSTGLTWAGKLNPVTGGILISVFAIYLMSTGYAIHQGIVDRPETSDVESEIDSEIDDLESRHLAASERSHLLEDAPERQSEIERIVQPTTFHIVRVIFGVALLALAAFILTISASAVADTLHLSEGVVGFTILAIATTLPEKGIRLIRCSPDNEAVVTNTAGSNIFLLTVCIGVISAANAGNHPISQPMSLFELASVWGSSAVFSALMFLEPRRWIGAVLLLAYVGSLVCQFTVYRA